MIDTEYHAIGDIVAHFKGLSGSDRARVLISADPKAKHGDLLKILILCNEFSLDSLYVENWIQYVVE